jgi:hypothetical protein
VRKAGSNAVAQQSVIFGQTTIYPSIQTMVSLLEDSELNPALGKKDKDKVQNTVQPPAPQQSQPNEAQPKPKKKTPTKKEGI